MTFQRRFLVAAVFLAVTFSASLEAASLTPHRAIYSLKMGQARDGSSFTGVDGAMTLVMEKSCEGWILVQSMTMEVSTAAGAVMRQDMRFTGLESLDGKSYRFVADNNVSGERKQIKGTARTTTAGAPGEIAFILPEAKTMELPEGTLFPIGHTSWLIDQALAGNRMAPRHVFDGADGDGPQEVVAFIGPRLSPAKTPLGALAEHPGWNIRLAFYPIGSHAAEPEYEVEVLQLENGVAPHLILDYPDFTVNMELRKIEAIKPPSC